MRHRPGRNLEHQCSLIHHCCGFDTDQNSNHSYMLKVHKLRTALLTGGLVKRMGCFQVPISREELTNTYFPHNFCWWGPFCWKRLTVICNVSIKSKMLKCLDSYCSNLTTAEKLYLDWDSLTDKKLRFLLFSLVKAVATYFFFFLGGWGKSVKPGFCATYITKGGPSTPHI